MSQREIKFRAWDKGNELFVYWHLDIDEGLVLDAPSKMNVKSDIVEPFYRFTGLKEKNGVEIYEGDIVYSWSQETKGSVDWINEKMAFMVSSNDYEPYLFIASAVEVIGNIHENKDLLQ